MRWLREAFIKKKKIVTNVTFGDHFGQQSNKLMVEH